MKIWQFLLPSQTPMVFTVKGNGGLSSWCWNPGLWACPVTEISLSRGIPPDFYPPHVNVGPFELRSLCTVSATLPLPPNLDECGFFKSLVVRLPYSLILWCSGCCFWDMVVILSIVAQGCEACLPIPTSWLEIEISNFKNILIFHGPAYSFSCWMFHVHLKKCVFCFWV